MVWDFVETNPFGGSVGDWTGPVLETALRAFESAYQTAYRPRSFRATLDPRMQVSPGSTLIATDPPYYANIGYADLSDFFYLWIRHALAQRSRRCWRRCPPPKSVS